MSVASKTCLLDAPLLRALPDGQTTLCDGGESLYVGQVYARHRFDYLRRRECCLHRTRSHIAMSCAGAAEPGFFHGSAIVAVLSCRPFAARCEAIDGS